ncbi:MAG: ATP-binding protein [Prevotella sp.]|nr:ATP-binding protein [Prevotella sp.]
MVRRQLQQIIQERMFQGKAIVLVGARQVGKSTLFHQILESMEYTASQQVLSLDCDDPETRSMLENMNLSELRLLVGNNKIIMVDEAQRVKGIGLTLKMLTDHFPDVQLMATGSSSFLLQGQLNESLTGRKYEYHLYPLSTQELYGDGGLVHVKQTLETRLIFGSYPDVLKHTGNTREILMNLSDSYLYQDLLPMEGIRRPVILEKLLVALALQIGSEVSYNELAQTVGTDSKTIEKYIGLLERCYIVFRLPALSRNVRTELKKGKKIYFYDNGIRNALIQNFNPIAVRQDMGALWENFFVSERKKYNHYNGRYVKSYFWRTTQQQEINYIEETDGTFTAFEMKWNPRKANASFPSTFLNAYPVADKTVVTPDNYLTWLI